MNDTGIDFTKVISNGVELKSCKKSYQSYKKHMHNELSIGIIREGASVVDFGLCKHTFLKGDGVIIPSKMSHLCSPEDVEDWRFDMLYIDAEIYEGKLEFRNVVKLKGPNVDKIDEFLSILDIEKSPEMIEERLVTLLIELEEETQETPRIKNENKEIFCHEIKEFIELNFDKKFDLDKLSNHFNISKYSLIRSFKKDYNTTPMAYQLQVKVAEAKKCLGQGVDVFDICDSIGFYDQAHFIREFHKMNGISPKAYVNKLSKES